MSSLWALQIKDQTTLKDKTESEVKLHGTVGVTSSFGLYASNSGKYLTISVTGCKDRQ